MRQISSKVTGINISTLTKLYMHIKNWLTIHFEDKGYRLQIKQCESNSATSRVHNRCKTRHTNFIGQVQLTTVKPKRSLHRFRNYSSTAKRISSPAALAIIDMLLRLIERDWPPLLKFCFRKFPDLSIPYRRHVHCFSVHSWRFLIYIVYLFHATLCRNVLFAALLKPE